ncbi:MAG: hypothetical protein LBJ67_13850 [Planctomycetaceae bacterium]|jgi:hypothetical protein|nr:hypothetical protein [Planctomycetaceae bacterium]
MRYVLLKHIKENDFHVDFLLDCGKKQLLTWQVKNINFFRWLTNNIDFSDCSEISTNTIETPCQRIVDHRRKYLDFEGEINNNRGFVEKIEWGEWKVLSIKPHQFLLKTIGTQKNNKIQTAKKWQFIFPKNFQHQIAENQQFDLLYKPTCFLLSILPPVNTVLRLRCGQDKETQ